MRFMYVKLFTQILSSSIADDRKLRHFFIDLLLCADATGLVVMTPSAIARQTGASIEEVEWGLAELEKPDPLSKSPDHEGRRIARLEGSGYGWQILNYAHYRGLKDADQMRAAVRDRVRRHREKKADGNAVGNACNAAGNAGNPITDADSESDADAESTTTSAPSVPVGTSSQAAESWPEPNRYLQERWPRWWKPDGLTGKRLKDQRRFVEQFEERMGELQRAFPRVAKDMATIDAIYTWESVQPSRQKTPGGRWKFIYGWLERAQNKGGGGAW